MNNFSESSKIIKNFADGSKDSDIEFFNKSDTQGFNIFETSFINAIKQFIEYTNKKTNQESLYISIHENLINIYDNKKIYVGHDKHDETFKKNFDIINTFIEQFNNHKQSSIHLKDLSKELFKYNNIYDELNSNDSYLYKSTEKRLKTISNKITEKKKEISEFKKPMRSFIKDLDRVNKSVLNLKELFIEMDLNALPKYKNNFAIDFVKKTGQSDVANFLNLKNIEETIMDRYTLSKGQKNEEVIVFNDGSIATKQKGVYQTPKINSGSYVDLCQEISHDITTFMLRKKPKYIAPFFQQMQKEKFNLNGMFIAINSFLKYEQILKNVNFDIIQEITKNKSFEKLDDAIDKIKQEHEINMLASSIVSSKYKHLYNDDVLAKFKKLYELKITKEDLQDNIGKKIAGFQKPEDLLAALQKYVNSLEDFDMDSVVRKSAKFNADIVVKHDDLLIIDIKDFEASKVLGSGSWCISRHENYFNSYVAGKTNKQFFIYDFTQDSKNNDSMIGITLDEKGEHYAAHVKNDDGLGENSSLFKKLQKTIIENNLDMFPNLDEKLKESLQIKQYTDKKQLIKNAI